MFIPFCASQKEREKTTTMEGREFPAKSKLGFLSELTSIIIIIIIFFFFFNAIDQVEGSIHDYRNENFIPQSNAFFFHGGSEGLYASKFSDHSSSSEKSSKGRSFIRFESVTFTRTKESAEKQNEWQQYTSTVEAIIVEVKDRERIGGTYLKNDAICCNQTLASEGHCKIGEVIMQPNPEKREWPKRIKIFFEGKNDKAVMHLQSVDINSTGMYYLYFMYCDPTLKGTTINGRTLWKNPDGYLPGKMTPLMKFYGFMSLAYLLLGLGWLLRFVQFWKDIIQLHYHITAVIALGMLEMALWYFDYSNLNATGVRPMGVTMWAVTFTAVKKTLSRLLLLVVSMGYGVVKPTLGAISSKVMLFGAVYFLASEALELYEHLGNINDFIGKKKLVLVLPVVFLDTCFILWIFSSLSNTLEKLQIRRSLAKLELYRKFTNALAIFVVLSIAWIGYELYFNATDPLGELWRIAWIIPAFWALLAYSLLVVICILWAPSRNPTRYAYFEESGDDLDEEGVSLTSSGVKVAADMTNMLERKERKVPSTTDHVFVGVREELEEDKRE